MSDEALTFYRQFYKEYFDENQKMETDYRGDCMNSLGWTFGKINKKGPFKKNKRSYTPLFTEEDIELFYQFRKMYHSMSNFIIIPGELNIWRGTRRENDNDEQGHGTCDYFDILLNLIRKYYFQEPMNTRMRSYIDPYKEWLDSFDHGKSGWITFIIKIIFCRLSIRIFLSKTYLLITIIINKINVQSWLVHIMILIGAYQDVRKMAKKHH